MMPKVPAIHIGQNGAMADLTAAEVHVLATLMESRPMTMDELGRALADQQMFADVAVVDATVRSLVEQGLVELTPAAHLGKYRLTVQGRNWVVGNSTKAW
jgi:DNA-binding MarR family transcriptional regulator